MSVSMFKNKLRILLGILLAGLCAGCVLPTVERYTSLQPTDYKERNQPAERYEGSPNELFEKGYLLIGYTDYTINVQTCYNDGTCNNHSDAKDLGSKLMYSAGERGADKVIILSTKLELISSTKSVCNYFNTSTFTDKDGNTHTITTCASYRYYPGHRESWQRRALFFRHQPDRDNAEKNYIAVRKAMESFERTNKNDGEKKGEPQVVGLREDFSLAEQAVDDYGAQLIVAVDAGNKDFLQKQTQSQELAEWEKKNKINLLMIAYFRGASLAARFLETQPRRWDTTTDKGYNAYHAAIGFADVENLKQLEKLHPYLVQHDRRFLENIAKSISMAKHSTVVSYFKQKQFDLNMALAPEHCTILHYSVLLDNLPVTKALVGAGADLERKCKDGSTPLLLAGMASSPKIFVFLVSSNANMRGTDLGGNTVLHYAATKSSAETLRYLLTLPQLDVQKKNAKDVDACVVAISQKNWQAVAPIIEKGALCEFPKEEHAVAAMGLLMREGTPNALRAYIQRTHSAENFEVGKGALLGTYCAQVCNQEKMEMLIALGLPPTQRYNGKSLFNIAREKNNEGAMVAILRKSYSEPKAMSDNYMLRNAIVTGDSKLVNIIRTAQGYAF